MSHSPEEVKKHISLYIKVFLTLAVLTVVTVAISYFHLPVLPAVALALAVALLKGTLVAGFFMHLFQEKPVILWILLLTAVLFFPLLLIPSLR